MRAKHVFPFINFLVFFFFFSCSDNPPEINGVEWQVVFFQNRLLGTTYQKLSVFVRGTDKDGQKDLHALHIINDDAELYWTMTSDTWEKANIRNSDWVGSNGLTTPDSSSLPVGMYRILLEDASGKTVQNSIYIQKQNVATENAQFPEIEISGNRISLTGNFVNPEIWIYDANDQFLFRFTMLEKSIDIKTITAQNPALGAGFSFYIFAKQSGVLYSVVSGPYYYSP
jgi:hypothetical protein